MIRRLNEKDEAICFQLLSNKPAENLFIIGDIENFGFNEPFQKLWGNFDETGRLTGILLKYHGNYICYAEGPFDAEGFADIINEDPHSNELSGLKSMTEQILPYIKRPSSATRELYYAKCEDPQYLDETLELDTVQLAGIENIPDILALRKKIPEFRENENIEEIMKNGLESKSKRIFFLKENNTILSSAATTAENSMSAMIVGVCTDPDHTKRGYASLVMTRLCRELLNEGKMLCLFYDNPAAGKIYKRLGFRDIGMWMMHSFETAKQPT
ncbi:GNAT family N-acetyltransferase [Halobacillus yeomjeoni]|uniref:GNAT family N-acetyltransferase n=1 Tax=Halobacillus yeomjeoni TaxID=311194 RepID=A0A931HXA9_9BACI|nr:GNAT family N-acetyltransferase [Halobacillus yeomjeoni]MBH0231126.1 GNAT family N-acetyltransferase [Halobacillus yeomjeoni]